MDSIFYKNFDLNYLIKTSLNEDIQTGDITGLSCINENSICTANLLVKQTGIICGKEIVEKILQEFDDNISIIWFVNEGDFVESIKIVAELKGNTRSILTVERTLLNFFQRLCGVATLTNLYVKKIAHTKSTILDTRKTIPAYRFLDKYAVKCGGGTNHRFGLYDMVMIKDNHIRANKSISNAVNRCVEYLNFHNIQVPIEVETKNIDEVKEALECSNIQRIMFDNFDIKTLNLAVQIVDGKKETEASGGVNLETIKSIAETGVQFISIGAITHSAPALDISLDLI